MTLLDTIKGLFTSPKTYTSPPNAPWKLENLRTAISPEVGLEGHLAEFTVVGKIKVDGIEIDYRIDHKRSERFWEIYVTSASDKAKLLIEYAVMGTVGARVTERVGQRYLETTSRELAPAHEIVDAVKLYQSKLTGGALITDFRIQPTFTDVSRGLHQTATEAELKLQEVKPQS